LGCLSKNIISLFSVARSNSWGDKSYIGQQWHSFTIWQGQLPNPWSVY